MHWAHNSALGTVCLPLQMPIMAATGSNDSTPCSSYEDTIATAAEPVLRSRGSFASGPPEPSPCTTVAMALASETLPRHTCVQVVGVSACVHILGTKPRSQKHGQSATSASAFAFHFCDLATAGIVAANASLLG